MTGTVPQKISSPGRVSLAGLVILHRHTIIAGQYLYLQGVIV